MVFNVVFCSDSIGMDYCKTWKLKKIRDMTGTIFYVSLTILAVIGVIYSIIALRHDEREAGLR